MTAFLCRTPSAQGRCLAGRGRTARRVLAIALASTLLGGCGVYILDPHRPTLPPAPAVPAQAAELVVVVHGGRGLQGWTVAVDGVARAWVPAFSGYTRIPVAPGAHAVRVTNAVREFDIVVVPLPPITTSKSADHTVDCPPAGRCALAIRAVLRPAQGLRVASSAIEITPLAPAAIDDEIRDLTYVAPGA